MPKSLIAIICLFTACYLPFNASAQKADSITLTGMVVLHSGSLPGTEVKLNPYNEGLPTYTTFLNTDGSFQFNLPVTDAVFYEVLYGGYSKSILFTRNELAPGFEIEVKDGKPNQMFISNSYENVAHELYRDAIVAFRDTLKGFRASCVASNANCIKYWGQIFTEHNARLEKIVNDYPQTFTAQVLVPMGKTPVVNEGQPPLQQMERHYFDGANFTDARTFGTPDIATKFIGYLNYLADTSKAGRTTFINDMFLKTMGNNDMRRKVGLALYNIFTKTNRENYLQSFEQWLDAQPWAAEELPVIITRLKLASKVLPGSPAPEVTAPDLNGLPQKLSDVVKTGKVTMALFWSSDCAHCRESMPDFKALYAKYHAAGLNVYAASLDTDADQWKKFVNSNDMKWTNVLVGQSNPALESYYIQATPSVALIDKKGLIIHRFMDVKDLEGYIQKGLK